MASRKKVFYEIREAHFSDVNALDEVGNVVITGSKDGTAKLWGLPRDGAISPLETVDVRDRIWSLKGNFLAGKFAVGTAGIAGVRPLRIYDLESCSEQPLTNHLHKKGAGILDIIWDSPNILLTCGYDTYLKKWDLRVGRCVGFWPDPTNATMYCLSSDYRYTVITGTQYNSKAVLWDQRRPNYVQLYFLTSNRTSSPLYSLSFDSCHLYGATDQSLADLDFSGRHAQSKNYRDILNYEPKNAVT